ncbi:MAG: hypothetical protein ABF331_07035, partial [Hellea sp.]
YLPNNRVLDIILNLDNALNSGSESIRWEIINDTLNKIEDSIFFGNYGFYTQYGGPSYFPHNFITVWINYGFLGFVLFFTIVVYMWFFAICNLKKFTGKCFVLFLVFMLVLIFFTISIIVSKHHLYIMFGFTVGVYSQLKHESRTPRIIQ